MNIQLDEGGRHARLDGLYTYIGAAPTLEWRTGPQPINVAAAATGTLLWTLVLPSAWMAAAAGGVRAKLGAWTANAVGAGVASHYRFLVGGACRAHGVIGYGPWDMQISAPSNTTTIGVSYSVTLYIWQEPNA